MAHRSVLVLAGSLLAASCNAKERTLDPPGHDAPAPDAKGSAPTTPSPGRVTEPPPLVRLSAPAPIELPAGPGRVSPPAEGLGVWVALSGIFAGPVEDIERVHEWVALQDGRLDPASVRGNCVGPVHDLVTEFVATSQARDPAGRSPAVVVFADRTLSMKVMHKVVTSISDTGDVASVVLMAGTEDGARGIPATLERFDVPAFGGALPTSYAVDFELVPVGDALTVFARARPESTPVATALWGGPARRLADRDGACLLSRQDAMAALARALEATCDTPSSLRLPVPEASSWGDFVGALPSAQRCQPQLRLKTPQLAPREYFDDHRPLPAPTDTDCSNAVSPDELLTALARDGETLAKAPEEKLWREVRAFDQSHPSLAKYRSAQTEIRPSWKGEASHVLNRLVLLQTDDLIACGAAHRKAKGDRHLSVLLSVDDAGNAVLVNKGGTKTKFETCVESRLSGWWFPELPGAPHDVLFAVYVP